MFSSWCLPSWARNQRIKLGRNPTWSSFTSQLCWFTSRFQQRCPYLLKRPWVVIHFTMMYVWYYLGALEAMATNFLDRGVPSICGVYHIVSGTLTWKINWLVINFEEIRAFSSGVLKVKYLIFGTPDIKNRPSSSIPNLKKFAIQLQYRLKYETVQTSMSKIFWLI